MTACGQMCNLWVENTRNALERERALAGLNLIRT